ncbi:MAG: lysophospholipid acyltransferase family protein [Verrucomicrobiae bacterium]|nr:lysophospholipid acyltransferase family protein [Verrucomicrobiae bacterium]
MMAEDSPVPAPRPKRTSGVVVPHKPTFTGRLLARTIFLAIRSVDFTLRYRLDQPDRMQHRLLDGPAIFAIWHNRLALSVMLYHRFVQAFQPERKMAAIASASRDGAMLARVIELLGVRPVRGSSSRRGAQALLEMGTLADQGYDLAVTPDGPRGPRYQLQPGVVGLAAATGLPILLASCQVAWKKQAPSWDRFQIPLPFSPVRVFISEPIRVPRDLNEKAREEVRADLERRMLQITLD